ncbi:MAG: hypothetical protein JGK17_28460 [Microcoleus sp. PH2017_10_PVI_O_A]|uniref:hypothetical protein n=1 Tax=unclassified Microcoleus TaxID=2642155 RepID=UPI001DE61C7A|nr:MULTISPECIES: hypothetical protein [unclassified Microcoleus]MCC3409417.1 hypothetical protein [Microcoleus sp. PH2017_10_PVI_O_A]MCC3463670.1 hypothetical protein [Microcoleus sp. PH2017_11_PCY_U_A]MCC3482033.1 hypothetical protein [Microcoleus sp. PH2017_12_PCY_D_A]MCC3531942.1 hypothetical protein [Microcoleus sp. PH2017_21_RUC_O_A]MCC3544277.1 hypothetical protein [Microcoleus sp. PH2017_22_RUC_O_B]
MLFRQYPQVLLTSFLIVGLTGKASIAFNIIPPNPGATRFYQPESIYKIDKNRESRTEIDMGLWSEPLPRGGTTIFNRTLAAWSFLSAKDRLGWSFNPAAEDLKGSFEVITYQACSPKDGCGGASTPYTDINDTYRGVGSLFHLKYHPGKGDPQPGEGKLHWIQMVQANYGSNVAGASRIPGISFIDNFNRKENPYYDRPNSRFAGEDFFMDQPYAGSLKRASASRNNYFTAQLYLVQETTPPTSKKRTITIYNGIRWGWKNTVTRRKEPVPVPAPTPNPIPFVIPEWNIPIRIPKGEPVASSASGGGGIGYITASPKPTPRPTPSPLPTPRPAPRPSPSPTPSPIILVSPAPSPRPAPTPGPAPIPSAWTPSRTPTPSAWTPSPWPTPSAWTPSPWPTPAPWATTPTPSPRLTSSPLPTPSPWTPSPWPTPTPWVTSPLGSTSSTVVVSTSTTTTTSPSSFQRPSSPIRAARTYATFGVDSDATDLANISSELLEDPELSSTDNSLNNANLAGVSRDLLEDSELSSTDSNENQVNLASISSDLLEDSESSSTDSNPNELNLTSISSSLLKDPESLSTDNNENQVDLASISGDLLEDPELSSTDSNENELDLAGISSDLLEDPELASEDNNSVASKTINPDDDALPAEAVPEPTTELGTLLALTGLGIFLKLKNRKTKE